MSQPDDPGPGSTPYGSTPAPEDAEHPDQPPHGQPQYAQPPYGQQPYAPSAHGGPPHDQPPHDQSPYGRPEDRAAYGQQPYGGQYGQPAYGAAPAGPAYGTPVGPAYGSQAGTAHGTPAGPAFGSQAGTAYGTPAGPAFGSQAGTAYGSPAGPAYGAPAGPAYGAPAGYGQYGYSAAPARPAHVIVPAVLGFVFAAFGVLSTLGVFLGGAAIVGMAGALDSGAFGPGPGDPFADEFAGDAAAGIGAVIVVLGLVALAWTVIMIWGSVWALTGRSRVLLLVGGGIAVLVTLIGVLGAILDSATADSVGGSEYVIAVVVTLLFFLASLAIVVPLCLRPATAFFAAHRDRRAH